VRLAFRRGGVARLCRCTRPEPSQLHLVGRHRDPARV